MEARRSLLARIKVAHPNFVERDRAVGRLNELRNEGVVPSAQWAVAIEALVAEQARFRSMQVADGELVKARRSQLEKLAVDDRLLSGRGSLKHLAEQVGRYRKDVADVPKLVEKMAAQVREFDALLARSGLTRDDLETMVAVTQAQQDEIEALAASRSLIEASLSTANAELGLANRELSQLVAEREALGDVYPVGPLKRAVEAARSESSLLDQIAENKRESLLASDRIEGLLRRLRIVHPDSADERALLVRSLSVPSSESVQAFRSQLRDLETEIGQSERSLADRRAQRAETVLALEAARSGVLAPDAETLLAARLRRDVGWASLRRKLDGGTGRSPAIDSGLEPEAVGRLDLPESWTSDVFEAAISTADVIADERYAEAEKLAVIDQFQHALAAHDDVIERLDEQLSRTRRPGHRYGQNRSSARLRQRMLSPGYQTCSHCAISSTSLRFGTGACGTRWSASPIWKCNWVRCWSRRVAAPPPPALRPSSRSPMGWSRISRLDTIRLLRWTSESRVYAIAFPNDRPMSMLAWPNSPTGNRNGRLPRPPSGPIPLAARARRWLGFA